jgi:hypothetical protein
LFSGAVLSGFGLTEYVQNQDRKNKFLSLFYIGIVVLTISVSIIFKYVPIVHVKFPLVILSLFTGMIITYHLLVNKFPKFIKIVFMICVIIVTYFDLFRLGYRFLTFSNNKFMYPNTAVASFLKETTKDHLGRVYGLAEPELPTYLGIQTIETYNPFYPLRTAQLFQALNGKDPNILPVNKFVLDKTQNLKRVFDVAGVSYIVVGKGENPAIQYFLSPQFEKDLTKIYSDNQYEVYKNVTAYPRFSLYYKAKTGLSDQEMLNDMVHGYTNLADTVLVEKDLPISLREGSGSATLTSSTLNSQLFAIDSTTPALFYISDTFFPGWKAFVNNSEVPIYRTNYNFRSILVPQGQSTVVFQFQPTNWYLYIGISGISLFLLILSVIFL